MFLFFFPCTFEFDRNSSEFSVWFLVGDKRHVIAKYVLNVCLYFVVCVFKCKTLKTRLKASLNPWPRVQDYDYWKIFCKLFFKTFLTFINFMKSFVFTRLWILEHFVSFSCSFRYFKMFWLQSFGCKAFAIDMCVTLVLLVL